METFNPMFGQPSTNVAGWTKDDSETSSRLPQPAEGLQHPAFGAGVMVMDPSKNQRQKPQRAPIMAHAARGVPSRFGSTVSATWGPHPADPILGRFDADRCRWLSGVLLRVMCTNSRASRKLEISKSLQVQPSSSTNTNSQPKLYIYVVH